jgi:dodecin
MHPQDAVSSRYYLAGASTFGISTFSVVVLELDPIMPVANMIPPPTSTTIKAPTSTPSTPTPPPLPLSAMMFSKKGENFAFREVERGTGRQSSPQWNFSLHAEFHSCKGSLWAGARNQENVMAVAKVLEISASSKKSFEDAIEQGIKRADDTIDNIEGAWVQEQKVTIKNGKIDEFRVNMRVTFILN